MKNKVEKYNELAPCGVYCGACPSFNKTCLGCASEDKTQDRCSKWGCKIRNCCYNLKRLDYCVNCEQFPCKIFDKKLRSTHQDDPRFTYRYELPELLNKFKTLCQPGLAINSIILQPSSLAKSSILLIKCCHLCLCLPVII